MTTDLDRPGGVAMRRELWIVVVALLAWVLAPAMPTTATHGTSQTKTYTAGGQGTFFNSCTSPTGIGGVRFCFLDEPVPTTVALDIRDASGLTTGGKVTYADAYGIGIGYTYVCGSTTIPVRPGSSQLEITIGLANALGSCVAGPGTKGSVTARWGAALGGAAPPRLTEEFFGSVTVLGAAGFIVEGSNIGGASIDPIGLRPDRIDAVGATVGGMAFAACQSPPGITCGGSIRGCGSVTLNAWRADLPVHVFAEFFETSPHVCATPEGMGWITVTFASS